MKGVRWEKYRNTMIHVTVTVLLLLVVDEVFGFEKVFLRTALIFGLILILQDL